MDTELLTNLESFRRRDVDTRNRRMKEGRLCGSYDDEMRSVHTENARALNELVAAHGWSGISKEVGPRG